MSKRLPAVTSNNQENMRCRIHCNKNQTLARTLAAPKIMLDHSSCMDGRIMGASMVTDGDGGARTRLTGLVLFG